MKVELISCTPDALELLLFTKNTRLQGVNSIHDVKEWTMTKKLDELEYMKKTIQSSFEFVNYNFKISGVTRTFTHQLVRSRHNSYAQEAMRAVDVRDHGWRDPFEGNNSISFNAAIRQSFETYEFLVDQGEPRQDARELLPTGIHTSIMVNANLRSLAQMAELRLCKRVQGEYQAVFKLIKSAVEAVHPWAEDFLQVACVKTGICQFPNYTECPVQQYTIKVQPFEIALIKKQWEDTVHEANPIAENGRSM